MIKSSILNPLRVPIIICLLIVINWVMLSNLSKSQNHHSNSLNGVLDSPNISIKRSILYPRREDGNKDPPKNDEKKPAEQKEPEEKKPENKEPEPKEKPAEKEKPKEPEPKEKPAEKEEPKEPKEP